MNFVLEPFTHLYLYMQMRHHLIKHASICILNKTKNSSLWVLLEFNLTLKKVKEWCVENRSENFSLSSFFKIILLIILFSNVLASDIINQFEI